MQEFHFRQPLLPVGGICFLFRWVTDVGSNFFQTIREGNRFCFGKHLIKIEIKSGKTNLKILNLSISKIRKRKIRSKIYLSFWAWFAKIVLKVHFAHPTLAYITIMRNTNNAKMANFIGAA
jgi:hypothetical protein